jgi:hypothetical protein
MSLTKDKEMKTDAKFKKALREAVANYMRSEGCSCCQDVDAHREHKAVLAKLLGVRKYSDGSGYDFSKYTK